ncbi:MAG TPA: metalloregulator ArsR/SmtB family transcription factor [Gemmatimonadales bacterium]|nr:metalloregulator ArsR/SmtB family transcription factor [Gemmatimonadales bacterium]
MPRVRNRSSPRHLDRLFRALGDQTRRAILAHLSIRPAKITDLARPFAISLPAVSRHVRVLEEAGLVLRSIDGRVHQCTANFGPLKEADRWLRRYRRYWPGQLDALAIYVEDRT